MSSPAPKKRSRTLLLAVVCIAVVAAGLFVASPGLRRSVMRLITPVPTEPLLAAVAAGDESTVYAWTLHGPNLDERTPEGLDALLLAARNGLTEITALLIGAGADVYSVDPAGNSAIHLAAAANHIYTIESLYLHGAPLNAINKANETPLHVTARANLPKAALMLMQAGANPRLRLDPQTASDPLRNAASLKHWDVVRVMVASGQPYGLLDAATYGDIEGIHAIMKQQPNSLTVASGAREVGVTPIFAALASGQVASAKVLQSYGAPIDMSSGTGMPLTYVLIRMGQRDSLRFLKEQGKSIDFTTPYVGNRTALHDQAKEGTANNIAFLVELGANLNAQDSEGQTPLHIAAAHGRPELAEELLKRGADPNIRNKKAQTPLELAIERKRVRVVELLSNLPAATP